jgi:hypothetical protein
VHSRALVQVQKGDRITKDSIELCQEGIEQVPKSTEKNSFEFWNRGSVKEDLHRITEHPVGSIRSCLSKRFQRGH